MPCRGWSAPGGLVEAGNPAWRMGSRILRGLPPAGRWHRLSRMNPGTSVRPVATGPPSGRGPAPHYVLERERAAAYRPREQLPLLRDAWRVGAAAHAGQTRKSGEPYITHPVAVATVLAELGLDAETL